MPEAEFLRRLEKLERDNRRLKRLGVAAFALVAGLGAIYATRPVPPVIKAQAFEVTDKAGNVRLLMDVARSGNAEVNMLDSKGSKRAITEVTRDGEATLSFLDTSGNLDLSIGAAPAWRNAGPLAPYAANSRIDLYGNAASGSAGISLGVTVAGMPSIVMYGNDKKHRVIWRAP